MLLPEIPYILCNLWNFSFILYQISAQYEGMKGPDFWEKYSLQLPDDDFRQYYHMDRSTLRSLTTFLNPVTCVYQGGGVQVHPHKAVGMTLFFLGSQLPYWQSAGIFGLSEECYI